MKNVIAIAAVVAASGTASADVITSYVNFGQSGDQGASPAGTVAANVSALPLTRGAGLNANPGGNSLNSSGWDSLDSSDYVTFGFEVAPGYQVDLDTLWFGSRSSNTGPGNLGVYYSVDGFASPVYTFSQSGTDFNNSIADLSALQDLQGNIEFRIYAVDGVSAGGGTISSGGTFRVGDHYDGSNFTEFRFEGSVEAVPAPASAALMALGGVVAGRRRR